MYKRMLQFIPFCQAKHWQGPYWRHKVDLKQFENANECVRSPTEIE